MSRPLIAYGSFLALAATIAEAQFDFFGLWSQLSGLFQTLIITLEAAYPSIVVFREASPYARKIRAKSKIDKSFAAYDAPMMDPNATEWLFKVNAPGKVGTLVESIEEIVGWTKALRGKHVMPTYLKTVDDVDAWVEMTRLTAMNASGLKFLNDAMRSAIIWHIVVDRLEAAGAPTPVMMAAKAKLEEHQSGPLYSALFNEHVCEKVSLTPLENGATYFKTYFQPLLISFDEGHFTESAGVGADDGLHAVMTHLNLLAGKRVRAMIMDGETEEPTHAEVRKALPRQLPGGPANKNERAEAKKYNRNQAAKAFLIVFNSQGLNQAEAFDNRYNPAMRLYTAGMDASCWTPDTMSAFDQGCYLWQCQQH